MRKLVELFAPMCKTDREFLCGCGAEFVSVSRHIEYGTKTRAYTAKNVVYRPARNWLALKSVPWDGFWPNKTICWSETTCTSWVETTRTSKREGKAK